jgi:hypothetical protein
MSPVKYPVIRCSGVEMNVRPKVLRSTPTTLASPIWGLNAPDITYPMFSMVENPNEAAKA